jgi:opacity protein-like surface antigen
LAYLRIIGLTAFALFAFTTLASAQSIVTKTPATSIEVVSGVMDYDFHGTGKTIPFAIRASRTLAGGLSLELGTTFARPDETFGRSTFTAPEARLQYAWRLGRVSPFVAGGGGVSATSRELTGTEWHTTLLAGGGARVDLTDRVYAVGEMRLRGVSSRFTASTAEWLGGIGWRFR